MKYNRTVAILALFILSLSMMSCQESGCSSGNCGNDIVYSPECGPSGCTVGDSTAEAIPYSYGDSYMGIPNPSDIAETEEINVPIRVNPPPVVPSRDAEQRIKDFIDKRDYQDSEDIQDAINNPDTKSIEGLDTPAFLSKEIPAKKPEKNELSFPEIDLSLCNAERFSTNSEKWFFSCDLRACEEGIGEDRKKPICDNSPCGKEDANDTCGVSCCEAAYGADKEEANDKTAELCGSLPDYDGESKELAFVGKADEFMKSSQEKIVIYRGYENGRFWCGPCKALEDELDRQGLPYDTVDVPMSGTNPEYEAAKSESNYRYVPLVKFPDGSYLTDPKGSISDRVQQIRDKLRQIQETAPVEKSEPEEKDELSDNVDKNEKGCCRKVQEDMKKEIDSLKKKIPLSSVNKDNCALRYEEFFRGCKEINEMCSKGEFSCQKKAYDKTKGFRETLPKPETTLAIPIEEITVCFDHDIGANKHVILTQMPPEFYGSLPSSYRAFLINSHHPIDEKGDLAYISPEDIQNFVPVEDSVLIGKRELTAEDIARRINDGGKLRYETMDYPGNAEKMVQDSVMKALSKKREDEYYFNAISDNEAIAEYLNNPDNLGKLPEGDVRSFYEGLHQKRMGSVTGRAGIDNLQVSEVPPLRRINGESGSKIMDEIRERLPPGKDVGQADYYMEGENSPSTDTHEGTHGLNSRLRNSEEYRSLYPGRQINAMYLGDGKTLVLPEPNIGISDVRDYLRREGYVQGDRFDSYLVRQQPMWEEQPLYILDELSAYTNGAQTAVELAENGNWNSNVIGTVDGAIEFTHYADGLVETIREKNPEYLQSPEGKKLINYLEWNRERVRDIAMRSMKYPELTSSNTQNYYDSMMATR